MLAFPGSPLPLITVTIGENDIDQAVVSWKNSPPNDYFTNILEATPVNLDSVSIPDFDFDTNSQRYRDKSSGKFISQTRVRELTKKRIVQAAEDTQVIGDLLAQGKITVPTWEAATRDAIKQLHIQQYLLGIGGKQNMSQQDYGILGNAIQKQYEFLNNFAKELTTQGMSEAQFKARLNLYLNASRSSFERAQLESHRRSGYLWEKRLRTKTESCNPCIEYAARGWQPIGTLPEPTQQCDCRANCGCYKIYSAESTKPSDMLQFNWGWL